MPKRKSDALNLTIGQRLKKFRNACNLTQEQVSSILNINRTTYTKYETGVSEPSHDLLKKIVAIYGIDFNAILGDDDTFEREVYDGSLPMYNLRKSEQNLVSKYRLLNVEQQKKVFELINGFISENNKDIK